MVQATASAYVGDIKVMSAELALSGTANDPPGTKAAGTSR
jgi:hypothetical protein